MRRSLDRVCDCLVALAPATVEGVTLFAKNSDRPPDERQRLVWIPPRTDDGAVRVTYIDVEAFGRETIGALVSKPDWMWGAEHGVNEAGVAIGNATIYTTLDPRPFPPALLGMDLVRLGLERAATASAAVETITGLLERHGQGGSGYEARDHPYWSSFLVADAGRAWVIETSGRAWAAEEVTTVRAISNRTTIETFDREHRHPRQLVATLVDPRWTASKELLGRAPVTRESLTDHLASHQGGPDGWTVCMHADGQATTASIVAELRAGGPPIAWCVQGQPCRGGYTRVVVGDEP